MSEKETSIEDLKEYIKNLESEITSFLWHDQYHDEIDTIFNNWEANDTPIIKDILIRSRAKQNDKWT